MATERPLLSIARKDLESGPKELRAKLPAAWITVELAKDVQEGGAFSARGDGEADLRVTPAGGDNYVLQGKLHVVLDGTCGRCLGAAKIPIDAEVTLLLVPNAAAAARAPKGKRSKDSEGEFEFDPDEADVATYDGDVIVLDPLVREAILLELPISPLCSEDCAGIPSAPSKGADPVRIDPRFAKLAGLRDRLPEGKKK